MPSLIGCHFFLRQRRKRFAFCLRVRGLVRPTVREALAFNTLQGYRRTFPVFHLAGVKLEIPFGQVAVKMRRSDAHARCSESVTFDSRICRTLALLFGRLRWSSYGRSYASLG